MADGVRLGVVMLPTDPWAESVATARELESLGYDHLWVYDHLSWRHYRDRAWHATHPWLTGIAMATSRIRLGTMVSNPNIRHPLLLAKDAMTMDHISDGRLIIGVGAGGVGFDATVMGQTPLGAGERVDRLAEFVQVLDGLLREAIRDHRGAHYTVHEARLLPGCVQQPRPPIAVAASGPRTLGLAGRTADAWITYGDTNDLSPSGTEAAVRRQLDAVERSASAAGRDPSTIDRIFLVGHGEERPLSSVEHFTDFLGRYGDLGFTDIVFHHPRADDPAWSDPPEVVQAIAAAHLSPHRST